MWLIWSRYEYSRVLEHMGDVFGPAGQKGSAERAYREALAINANMTSVTAKLDALDQQPKKTPLPLIVITGAVPIAYILARKRR